LQNRNITALVREYIEQYEENKALDVPALTKGWLMRDHGIKGAYRNLYAQVHVILKKETQSSQFRSARLAYVKGSGYFKRKRDETAE
jgi:hypothetical protein